MAHYLSDEWFEEMEKAAAEHASSHSDAADVRAVSLRETIHGTPYGDVSYVMDITDQGIHIDREADTVADVTFSQDYETAAALHRGEITTQEAFFAGRVRVAGHLNTLMENAETLQGINATFKDVRERTTY